MFIFLYSIFSEIYPRELIIRRFWASPGIEKIKGGFERWNGQLGALIYAYYPEIGEIDGCGVFDSLFFPITPVWSIYGASEHYLFMTQTFDAQILLCGYIAFSPSYNKDIFIYKKDEWLKPLWAKRIYTDLQEEVSFITEIENYFYIFMGNQQRSYEESYGIIGKMTYNGNVIWIKRFGWGNERCNFLIKYNEIENLLISETKGLNGSKDILISRIDTNGNLIHTLAFVTQTDEILQFLESTQNRKFIGVGWSRYFGDKDILLIEIDSSLNLVDALCIGSREAEEVPVSFIKTKDNGYAIAGLRIFSNDTSSFIIKFDENMNIEWSKIINLTYPVIVNSLIQSTKGDLIAFGKIIRDSNVDALIMNITLDGVACNEMIDFILSTNFISMDTFSLQIPIIEIHPAITEYWLYMDGVHLFSETICEAPSVSENIERISSPIEINIYPDGFIIHSFYSFSSPIYIKIFDLAGRKVFEKCYKDVYFIKENFNLPKGIYFLNLSDNLKEKKVKFLKIK